jgi:Cu+-exporting ATPase
MKRIELAITGMHCASCSVLISRALQKAPGVKMANVNYSAAKALVEFDEAQVDENKLLEVVKSKGYGAIIGVDREREKQIREKEISDLKILFIISVVFFIFVFIHFHGVNFTYVLFIDAGSVIYSNNILISFFQI